MWARVRKTVADHGPLLSSVSAIVAILVSAGGLLFSQGTRDWLVDALGGVTQADYAAFRDGMTGQAPAFRFYLLSGLDKDQCLVALTEAATNLQLDHAPRDSIAVSDGSVGIRFSLMRDGQAIGAGSVDCFVLPQTQLPGEEAMIIVVATDTIPSERSGDWTDAFRRNFGEALGQTLPDSARVGLPALFRAETDAHGRLVMPETYQGFDIVPQSLYALDPVRIRDIFHDDRAPSLADLIRMILDENGG